LDPRDLKQHFENKFISGLFLPAKINGTETGYERKPSGRARLVARPANAAPKQCQGKEGVF